MMATKKENLIIIMSDEHQGSALGCLGHPFVKTPNLDELADNGQSSLAKAVACVILYLRIPPFEYTLHSWEDTPIMRVSRG